MVNEKCYNFDILVNREDIGNMKYDLTPDDIKAEGLISFAGTEFDFPTAPVVISYVMERARNGLFGYTIQDSQYNQAVMWWMKNIRNWDIQEDWIVPTLGTIHSLTTCIHFLLNKNESIIVQPPVYYRYEQAATRNNKGTCYNPLKYNPVSETNKVPYYEMDFERLERAMSLPENKLFVLCNPHNPIGQVWKEKELREVARLAKKYNVAVFSDEIFAETTYDENSVIAYSDIPEAADNCIVATSIGKSFGFTGINHANIIIPNQDLRERFIKQRYADHYGSLDPLVHAAVLGAYSAQGADWLRAMNEYVWENSLYVRKTLAEKLPQVNINLHQGAYVNWIDWKGLGLSDKDAMDFLLKDAKFHMEEGCIYGEEGSGFTRLQIACPRRELKKAVDSLLNASRERGFLKE